MYKRILIATDGSELAMKGLQKGLELAAQLGARVDIVTVSEPWAVGMSDARGWSAGYEASPEYKQDREAAAQKILQPSLDAARAAGVAEVIGHHVLDRYAADGIIETAGERYEAAIEAAGGVDLQILGIGRTGHIGFNEPGSSLASLTRVKTLTEPTRADNARFFSSPDEVPMHCITQGIGTILRARHLVLLAFGAAKAHAVAAAVEGPVTASQPGSAIQLHPHATVVIDEAAAAELEQTAYYRYAWDNKPAWQGI